MVEIGAREADGAAVALERDPGVPAEVFLTHVALGVAAGDEYGEVVVAASRHGVVLCRLAFVLARGEKSFCEQALVPDAQQKLTVCAPVIGNLLAVVSAAP
jgi:hypothetical protein